MEKVLHHIEKYSPTGAKVTFTIPLRNHQEICDISKNGKHWICTKGNVSVGYQALTMLGVIRQIKDQMIITHNL